MSTPKQKRPIDEALRQNELRRYEQYVALVRDLQVRGKKRPPTAAELRPIFADSKRGKEYAARGKQLSDARVMTLLEKLKRRVGAHVGAKARIADIVGSIAEKAVEALDEQLDPATRSSDSRMVKAVGDLAAKTLEIAGHSQEEKGGGGGVHVTVAGVSSEESESLRQLRERLHRTEQEKVGIGGGRIDA